MKHAAHKAMARTTSHAISSQSHLSLFSLIPGGIGSHGAHGSHSVKAAAMARTTSGDVAEVAVSRDLAKQFNAVAPVTRRSIRESAQAAQRKSMVLTSSSLAALVGAAATAMSFSNPMASVAAAERDPATTTTELKRVKSQAVSRSEDRTDLSANGSSSVSAQTTNQGSWQLSGTNTDVKVDGMTRATANNPQVATWLDADQADLPHGFDPNHATGDSGNAYEFSQCTWWVYVRRHQLGLPAGSHMGNGNMWGNSARALGYWVDHTARHVGDIMVFAAGQDGTDATYGHVAIIEKINPDGSVETSECGSVMNGKTYSHTYSAASVAQHDIIHY